MPFYNIVRFRTRPGKEEAFVEKHQKANLELKGFHKGVLVETGDRMFCFIGEWDDQASLAAARLALAGFVDSFSDLLEDLGDGLGVTDPLSGTMVAEMKARRNAS